MCKSAVLINTAILQLSYRNITEAISMVMLSYKIGLKLVLK